MDNLSCIPFYKTKEEQDFRLWYAYGEKYPHYVPGDFLVPFFFSIPYGVKFNNISVQFFKACCTEEEYVGVAGNLSSKMVTNGLVTKTDDTIQKKIVAYYAKGVSSLGIEEGMYYMKITLTYNGTNVGEYYSDAFFVKNRYNLTRKVMVEWRNKETLEYEGGFIPYGETEGGVNFINRLYLDTTIGMPEYTFTEDGEERNGRFFPIKQISEKVYKMSFIAPEYLCDAMRLIRMADYIKITDGLGRTYDVEQFEMDVKWSQGGHYAEVSCSFQTDTIVKKIGKAYSI